MRDRFDLSGRVAIVTGATRGIGRAIAEGLVAAGAAVVVASRKTEAVAETVAHLENMTADVTGVTVNMGDPEAAATLVGAAAERFGRLDIVVNNAANALALPFGSLTREAWDKSYAVNLRGPVFLVQEALPLLAESPGAAVVNVVSDGAFMWSAGMGLYSGAKAALLQWTRVMAAELAPRGIRVNALAPGTVDTDMVRNNPAETVERMASANLMRRMAEPAEMVGPALFLVSDASSFVTGQVLVADGGLVPY
jgi:NAD(P)-dependent dehydrogenase (short-subunit alcohol dehydrogenase family)